MPLNDMSFDELNDFSVLVDGLTAAGSKLADAGLEPMFNLTPGQPVTIRLGAFVVPEAPPQLQGAKHEANEDLAERLFILDQSDQELYADHEMTKQRLRDLEEIIQDNWLHLLPASRSAGPSRPEDEAAPPPAAGETDLPQVSPTSTGDQAESGGGAAPAAAAPPAEPVAVGSPANPFVTPPWTEEEDARLIGLVVENVHRLGMSRRQAIIAAARKMGRAEGGAEFRCNRGKLKDPLDEALTAAYAATPESPTPYADAALANAEEAASEPAPTKAWDNPDYVPDPLTAHLMAVPEKDGWTLARDLELMQLTLAGWKPNEIALELRVRPDQVKARFDVLTGLHTDEATGKPVRIWPRERVCAALTGLATRSA